MTYIALIIAPLFWAITAHIDKYLISKVIKNHDWRGLLVFSSFIAGLIFMPIYAVITNGDLGISLENALIVALSAIALTVATILYYKVLTRHDASTIAVMFQLIPVFTYILGLIFFDEQLSILQFIGIVVVTIAAIGVTYEPEKTHFNKSLLLALGIMAIASFCHALSNTLFRVTAVTADFNVMTFWLNAALCVIGLLFLFRKSFRSAFSSLIRKNGPKVLALNITNEALYSAGSILARYAALLIPIAIVSATTETLNPIFTLILGVIITTVLPKIEKENIKKSIVIRKVVCIALSAVGIALLYIPW